MQETDEQKLGDRLKTKFVFVDTQAFRAAGLDWTNRSWVRFAQLARDGVIKPLTTNITKRELERRLTEALEDAENAARKHRAIFGQLAGDPLGDGDFESRKKILVIGFEKFLKDAAFFEVPLKVNPEAILDDYFSGAPPFGPGAKKSEFPDAFILQSISSWLSDRSAQAYVVSDDGDLKSFCEGAEHLIHAGRLNEFLSLAQAHGDLLEALEEHVRNDAMFLRRVQETLAEYGAVSSYDVDVSNIDFTDPEIASVLLVDDDEAKDEYLLEVEIYAQVAIEASETKYEMVIDRHGEPDMDIVLHRDSASGSAYFYAEVTVTRANGKYETVDWYFSTQEIDIKLPRGFDASEVRLRR